MELCSQVVFVRLSGLLRFSLNVYRLYSSDYITFFSFCPWVFFFLMNACEHARSAICIPCGGKTSGCYSSFTAQIEDLIHAQLE